MAMSDRQNRIADMIQSRIACRELWVENESHGHGINRGVAHPETHFKILVVSDEFSGKSRIDRQRIINDLLKSEFESGLHALTQRLLTFQEWEKQQATVKTEFVSPLCRTRN